MPPQFFQMLPKFHPNTASLKLKAWAIKIYYLSHVASEASEGRIHNTNQIFSFIFLSLIVFFLSFIKLKLFSVYLHTLFMRYTLENINFLSTKCFFVIWNVRCAVTLCCFTGNYNRPIFFTVEHKHSTFSSFKS